MVDLVKVSSITNLKKTETVAPTPPKVSAQQAKKTDGNEVTLQKTNKATKPDKDRELDKMLSELDATPIRKSQLNKQNVSSSTQNYKEHLPLTVSEVDSIKARIEDKFSNPIMQQFKTGELVIKLRLTLNEDGSVQSVVSSSDSRYSLNHMSIFHVLKDALIRAVHMASPFKDLPPEKYLGLNGWKEVVLTFDGAYLMNN
jgi:ribonuclease BN (tRNA processing enzyme)